MTRGEVPRRHILGLGDTGAPGGGPTGTADDLAAWSSAGQVIDVREAGARGDGVHDDTPAIAAAARRLRVGGLRGPTPSWRRPPPLFFPAGRYRVEIEPGGVLVDLPDRSAVLFDPGAVLVVASDAGTAVFMVRGTRDVTLTQVRLQALDAADRADGDLAEASPGGGLTGVLVQGARDVSLRDCAIEGMGHHGVWVGGGSDAVALDDCDLIGCGGDGARIDRASDVTITHGSLRDNHGAGVGVGLVDGPVVRTRIIASHGEGNAVGVQVGTHAERTEVVASTWSHGGQGLTTAGRRTVVVSGAVHDNDGDGIVTTAGDGTIEGNVVRANRGAGLRLGDGAHVVTANQVYENGEQIVSSGAASGAHNLAGRTPWPT